MAQINLLKPTGGASDFKFTAFKYLPRVFLAILAILILYYAWLFVEAHNLDSQSTAVQDKMNSEAQSAISNAGRSQLLTRQQQLSNFTSLVAAHLYWSQIFPELARVTLKTATYQTMQVQPETNSLLLTAQVPSFADFDKYMQVFDLGQFNQYFSNIKISGFGTGQTQTGTVVTFTVTMNYDPSLIQYHPAAGQ